MECIAKTFAGLEGVLANELQQLGASQIVQQKRAVIFDGDLYMLYKANYRLTTALHILIPLFTFKAENEVQFYKEMGQFDWTNLFFVEQTFLVETTCRSDFFRHSQYLAQLTKDAIVDQFRAKLRRRPSVDTRNGQIRIHVQVRQNEVRVFLDSSGDSLHRRGYRDSGHEAPMNEVLAAGIIRLTQWDKESSFIDPMCGTATIPIEAAFYALNRSPHKHSSRKFGFMFWKDFDAQLWQKVRKEAHDEEVEFDHFILGADISERFISQSRKHIAQAGLIGEVSLELKDFKDSTPPPAPGICIINPPYGERLKPEDLPSFYKLMGDALKNNYKGYQTWICSSSMDGFKNIGLRSSIAYTVFNGALECKLKRYDLYEGSRKVTETLDNTEE